MQTYNIVAIDATSGVTSAPFTFQVDVIVDCTGVTLTPPALSTLTYDVAAGGASVADLDIEAFIASSTFPCEIQYEFTYGGVILPKPSEKFATVDKAAGTFDASIATVAELGQYQIDLSYGFLNVAGST